jgi:predicted HAD superfamily Cof-like phosphohydrolase
MNDYNEKVEKAVFESFEDVDSFITDNITVENLSSEQDFPQVFNHVLKSHMPPSFVDMLVEFHKTFKHVINEKPTIPDEQTKKLRIALIKEEVNELLTALENDDMVGIADGYGDALYVIMGTLVSYGLHNCAYSIVEEIHSSNMSKGCASKEEAMETKIHYLQKGTDCHIDDDGSFFTVRRTTDNKLLKSVKYRPVDLKKIIDKELLRSESLENSRTKAKELYTQMLENVSKLPFEGPKINEYICEKAGHVTKTIENVSGITPMFITCPQCLKETTFPIMEKEESSLSKEYFLENILPLRAVSSFYVIKHPDVPVTYEWIRPDFEHIKEDDMEHVFNGGLVLCSIPS